MAKLAIKKASTDVTTYVFIQDSSKTTGEGLAGLAYNTTDLVASYVRPLAARAAITLATQTVTGAHSDGGFVEVDATNMPGVYRLDLPDAVCATGVNSAVVMLKGAANMSPVVLELQLTDFDLNTAAITAAGIADAVWDEAISGHTTGTTFGGKNQKVVPSETINDYKADVSALTNVTLAATQTGVTIPTVTTLTNLPAATTDWLTAAAVKADAVSKIQANLALEATLTAIKGAGWSTETLAAIDVLIDAIKAKTDLIPATPAVADEYDAALAAIQADLDNPAQYKADVSGLATAAALTTVDNEVGVIDGIVAAIKAKTDNLPANTATALAAIQSDLDNPAQYKADVSGLATQASVNEIPTTPLLAANYVAPDNASIAAILEDTGTTIPATLTTIDNEIAVIDGNVDAILDDTGTSGVLLSTSALTSIFDDEVIVGSYNFSDLLKIMASALAGKLSGGGTTTLTFRGVDDTSDVIVATVDANGNRSALTLTV